MADPISIPLSAGQQRLFAAWTAEGKRLDAALTELKTQVNVAANAILAGAVEDLSTVHGWTIDASGVELVATPPAAPALVE